MDERIPIIYVFQAGFSAFDCSSKCSSVWLYCQTTVCDCDEHYSDASDWAVFGITDSLL